jgi:hypothetical protein
MAAKHAELLMHLFPNMGGGIPAGPPELQNMPEIFTNSAQYNAGSTHPLVIPLGS